MTLLCFSARPLTINELIDAHAVDLSASPHLDREGRSYEQNDLIDICLGLIEISKTEDSGQQLLIARIAHFSVQEYLQSERIQQQKANRFAIQSGPANTEITQICLVYLLEPMLSSGVLDTIKIKEFPLAHFAAEYWYHHYVNSREGRLKVEELLQRLFQYDTNCFVTWIRIYGLDRQGTLRPNSDYQRPIDDIGSPFYYASLLGLESTLSNMIAAGARDASFLEMVNAQSGEYGNALQAASSGGHWKVVQMLLDQGADVNAQSGRYGNALHAASSRGHKKVVQMLLDHGANVSTQGRELTLW